MTVDAHADRVNRPFVRIMTREIRFDGFDKPLGDRLVHGSPLQRMSRPRRERTFSDHASLRRRAPSRAKDLGYTFAPPPDQTEIRGWPPTEMNCRPIFLSLY